MKNFKKQALAVITMIMLLAAAACNSLSPDDTSVTDHDSLPTQADGEFSGCSEIIDLSEPSPTSEEMSDEISEEFSEEISEEFSESSSDESIFESSSEEVSAVIEPFTEQATKVILRVENGKDFEFHDSEEPFVLGTAPMAFFVDSDETAWVFDPARHRNDILVYKNNKLTATINVPDFSTYGGIYMYGDENYIYLVNESDNYFVDGKVWIINKETHSVTSEVYYTCDKSSSSAKKEYPQYFMTINGNVYLYVSDNTESESFQDEKDVYYLINGENLTRCTDEKYSITTSNQTGSPYPLFTFSMPENMSGTYKTKTYGHYVRFLKADSNGWLVISCLEDFKHYNTIGIYNYNSKSRLLSFAYTLPTKDRYSYIEQEFTTSPNGNVYRMEACKGKDFAGITISKITLGTHIPSAEELTRISDEYKKEMESPQTSDNMSVTSELVPSSTEAMNTLLTPEQVNALFPTGITREQVYSNAKFMCNEYWKIVPGNLDIKNGNTANNPPVVPEYIWSAGVGATVQGIPYSFGGFNGMADLGNMNNFYDCQKHGYLTGNISGDYVKYSDGTNVLVCGLDCSGFVSAAYNINYKLQSWDLQHLGTLVENINDMKKMDLIVSANEHCLLFDSYNSQKRTVGVYDCTIRRFNNWIEIGKCSYRTISYDEISNFQFRTPWNPICTYTYVNNGSTHTKTCTDCGETITESHRVSSINDQYHESQCACGKAYSPQHQFVYTYYATTGHRKSCSICDYSAAESHVYNASYTSNGKSGHTASCLCGASKTEAHTPEGQYRYDASKHYIYCADCGQVVISAAHTIQNHICTVCGYNDFVFTENGKIYFGNNVSPDDIAAVIAEFNKVS